MDPTQSFFSRLLSLIKSIYNIYHRQSISTKLTTFASVGTACLLIYNHLYINRKSSTYLENDEIDATIDPEIYLQAPLDLYRRNSAVMSGEITQQYRDEPPSDDSTFIKHICLIVVVDAEIRPIMDKYKFVIDENLTKKLLNLGIVSGGMVNNLYINIIKVAESKVFKRHYSGYTQASALAALVSSIIKPDLVISFGTAGGITDLSYLGDDKDIEEEKNDEIKPVKIGDVIFGEECLFLDRLRSRNQKAFDWGLWGGVSIETQNLCTDLGLVKGIVGSQVGYNVTEFQVKMIKNGNIVALDMECAPIAQILNQTGINFMALKVISNGTYPGTPEKMEDEYHQNREMVSKKATQILVKVIDYLNNKRISDL